jgi:hypothetical protein
MWHRNALVYLNVATIFFIIFITANMSAIAQAIIAEPYTYLSAIWAGSENSLWLHLVLVPLSVVAGIAVGAGILLERPRFAETTRQFALWSLMVGVPLESLCTILLLVVDERISAAQQSKIITLETLLAPRQLTDENIRHIVMSLAKFPNVPFDVAVDENEEPRHLLGRILTALSAAHWDRKSWGGPAVGLALYLEGKAIAFMPGNGVVVAYAVAREKDLGPPAKALAFALTKEGIPTSTIAIAKAAIVDRIRLSVGVKP